MQPRKLSPGSGVDLRAQGHTSAGRQRAGNRDSQVTRLAAGLSMPLCSLVGTGLVAPPAAAGSFSWGRSGEYGRESNTLEVILNIKGWVGGQSPGGWLIICVASSCFRWPPSLVGGKKESNGRSVWSGVCGKKPLPTR